MTNTARSASAAGPIDVLVGARIRLRRTLLGMSQEKLGAALGLTFQQVQKYERGANKVGASRLYEMSRVLDVPIGFFFDDLAGEGTEELERHNLSASGFSETPTVFADGEKVVTRTRRRGGDKETGSDDLSTELLRAFRNISDARVRRQLVDLIKCIAATA